MHIKISPFQEDIIQHKFGEISINDMVKFLKKINNTESRFALYFYIWYYAFGTFNKLGGCQTSIRREAVVMNKKDFLILSLVIIIFLLLFLLFIVLI